MIYLIEPLITYPVRNCPMKGICGRLSIYPVCPPKF
jgi:hypothetical protein